MNAREQSVAKRLKADGWNVIRNGWPDLLCLRGAEIMAVEVKGLKNQLQPNQKKNHIALRKAGIKTVVIVENQTQHMSFRGTPDDESVINALTSRFGCSFGQLASMGLRKLAEAEGLR